MSSEDKEGKEIGHVLTIIMYAFGGIAVSGLAAMGLPTILWIPLFFITFCVVVVVVTGEPIVRKDLKFTGFRKAFIFPQPRDPHVIQAIKMGILITLYLFGWLLAITLGFMIAVWLYEKSLSN